MNLLRKSESLQSLNRLTRLKGERKSESLSVYITDFQTFTQHRILTFDRCFCHKNRNAVFLYQEDLWLCKECTALLCESLRKGVKFAW